MDPITKVLLSLGVRRTLKGFRYLKYGIELCMDNDEYLLYVFKELYPAIAERFDTDRKCVERCIRTAVEACWYKGNKELLIKLNGFELTQKPTNGDFIDIVYQYLLRRGTNS